MIKMYCWHNSYKEHNINNILLLKLINLNTYSTLEILIH